MTLPSTCILVRHFPTEQEPLANPKRTSRKPLFPKGDKPPDLFAVEQRHRFFEWFIEYGHFRTDRVALF
uniref:Uncharacterized protein n=1 Tax=Anguilla anguilla TaxID=7936 RepID=A0A0E9PV73_ANGAN